ncbi:hypothetical protein BH10PSE14_BH10PSE14_13620 [soil metagenome]
MKSIGTSLLRIQAVGATLFVLIAVIVGGAMVQTRAATSAHQLDLKRVSSVMEVADLISENRIAEAYVIFDQSDASRILIDRTSASLSHELDNLRRLVRSGPYEAQGRSLDAAWRDYRIVQTQLAGFAAARRTADALRLFKGPLHRRYRQIDTIADRLGAEFRATAATAAVEASYLADLIIIFVLAFAVIGVALIVAARRFIRDRIVRALAAITTALTDLAAGDIHVLVSGGDRRDEIGQLVRALEIFRKQSSQLAENHRQMIEARARAESMARHDALTGLPNRRMFIEGLTAMTAAKHQPAAVFLIDLDRFKPINDAYGHEAGDEVLCELARRFAAHRQELGTVARIGGDEFAVAFPTSSGRSHAARIAQLINIIVAQPIQLHDKSVEVGATVGIALFPGDGDDPAMLLRAADLAMYGGKEDRSCRYRFFEPSLETHVQERALLRADLRRAISADEIRPHYQPLVLIEGGGLVGFEILARWYHPVRGIIMPDAFIELAEEVGLINDLTFRILRQACTDVRLWPDHLRLSLNLAPSQIRDRSVPDQLLAILAESGISPARLEVEITENALITDLDATRVVLASLQSAGVSIALDDFGTGYASLNHLRDLKFDKIKIDRSFLRELDDDHGKNAEIVHAIISLSKILDLTTTAEGIEDAGQLARLAEWGCDLGQGFFFGEGMTAANAATLVADTDAPSRGSASDFASMSGTRRRA